MLTFLKGVGSNTIVTAVCVVVILLSLTVTFLYKSNNSKLVENGGLKSENTTLQQNEDYMQQSAKITDTVVSDFVTEKHVVNETSEKLRKESIHEYVKSVEPPKPEGVQRDDRAAGDLRVTKLAQRLHENYCRARPKDPDCNTVDTDSGLLHK